MPMTRDCVSDIRNIIVLARRSVVRQLRNCRLFYKAYPTETEIRYTLCIKLSWTHHRAIMRVQEPKARAYCHRQSACCSVLGFGQMNMYLNYLAAEERRHGLR
ncbi:MAG: DUF1016 N-terminal domain-containing protein [Kiritimatiellae bacterium]|nr:DUF1016 N-terminal domain-containing protein [Kiritimatiellia bacterium]